MIDKSGEYQCQVLLFNSGHVYTLGTAFLKDYYAVYDSDSYQFGLGRIVDFDAPPPPPKPDPNDAIDDPKGKADEQDGTNGSLTHDDVRNGLIFGGIALVFIIISCIICKKRRDADRN